MHALTLISALYGQGRGFRRLDIRRRVAANQRLPREELARISNEAFQHHVHRCIARFPEYSRRVEAHRGSLPAPGERVSPVELPVWTREDQNAFFARQSPPPESHYVRRTSGSTGYPVNFRVTRESYEWRSAVMDRNYSWAGAEDGVKSVYIWGLDADRGSLSHRVKNAVHLVLQRRTYVDVFQKFSDTERAACCETINRVKPKSIVGYAGMLADIARYARDHNALTWKARTAVCAAEELQTGQRELLETHLAGEVFNSYGCREFMSIGMECERHAGYHIATDNLLVEVVDDTGRPVPAGKTGRIVITDLHNAATPFVRYEIGDIGVMAPPGEACACGRPFPILMRVEGRLQDVIQTPQGPVTALYIPHLWEFEWIEGFQVAQHTVDRLIVRLLTRVELTPERLAPVTAVLRVKLGDMAIDYERVDALTRRPNGKVETVISTLPREEQTWRDPVSMPERDHHRSVAMHRLTWISALYGQARGYHRLDIRRTVAANERLTRAALARASEEAFQRRVRQTIDKFPLYAQRVKAHRGSLPAPGQVVRPEELPVWTRTDQREFFARQPAPEDSHYVRESSGSTGVAVQSYVTRESYEWRTAVMDRSYSWAGAEEGVKSLYVWGLDTRPQTHSRRIKHSLHLALQRRAYFDAYQVLSDAERAACCELINRLKPRALVGYTNALIDIARYARDHGGLEWKGRTLVACAEGLRSGQRELLKDQLVDDVFDSYGSREFMNIGMECERHMGYHIASDNLRVEVVDGSGQPVPAGEEGRIIVTDLHNAANPFVRYEVGDIGVMAPAEEVCPCGRPFPILKSVDGRIQDVLQTPNGPMTTIFFTFTLQQFPWVEGFQVVQHEQGRVLIRLLSRAELTPERLAPVTAALRTRLRDMAIEYEHATELSRRPNGKVQLVVSTLTPGI